MYGPFAVSHAQPGSVVVLKSVAVQPEVRRRLAELGLRSGSEVTIVQRTVGDGRVLGVAGARIAVDAATARRMYAVPPYEALA